MVQIEIESGMEKVMQTMQQQEKMLREALNEITALKKTIKEQESKLKEKDECLKFSSEVIAAKNAKINAYRDTLHDLMKMVVDRE